MSGTTTTDTENVVGTINNRNTASSPLPGLLVVHSPPSAVPADRMSITEEFSVGRSKSCSLRVIDRAVSKKHFRVFKAKSNWFVEDLGSTNKTYVNGHLVTGQVNLSTSSVIRAGNSVFIFHANVRGMLDPPEQRYGFVGGFHVEKIVMDLEHACISQKHILITGPTGSGKELAAQAVSQITKTQPVVTANAARYASEDEATASLFGVAKGVFSMVDARPGLIETARNGVLFLDEVHNLPERVQRSLLRVIEDKKYSRFGETASKTTQVRFVFASNASGPKYSLAHDLLPRLRRVSIAPLRERIADIPDIFNHLVTKCLERFDIPPQPLLESFDADLYELLCLHAFDDNVRGLLDIADRFATHIAKHVEPDVAIAGIFDDERFENNPVADRVSDDPCIEQDIPEVDLNNDDNYMEQDSPAPDDTNAEVGPTGYPDSILRKLPEMEAYKQKKDLIIRIYMEEKGNISATQRRLQSEHRFKASRANLTNHIKMWGLPPKGAF